MVDLEDVAMLEINARRWHNRGLAEVLRRVLLRLMESRFGPLPQAVQRSVQRITSPRRLEELTGKVLVAASPQEMGLG